MKIACVGTGPSRYAADRWLLVKGGADLGIPDVEAEGGSMIAIGGGEIC